MVNMHQRVVEAPTPTILFCNGYG